MTKEETRDFEREAVKWVTGTLRTLLFDHQTATMADLEALLPRLTERVLALCSGKSRMEFIFPGEPT